MKLLMVRHGEISSNLKKVYAGKSSEELCKRGLAQAKEVSETLKYFRLNALYSSPMQRAIQTAKIIGEAIGLNVWIEKAFQEMKLGPWEGLSEIDISQIYPKEWQIWQTHPAELKMTGRETLKELQERVLKGIQKLYQVHKNQTVVVVTHVAIIRVLLLWQAKKNLNLYKTICVPNAKIFGVKIDTCPR